ncbi:LpqB family beta-propeller domain-containing protein [Jiangella sp. DSM 45060]|uniref:dipeptidyl-peptidase 5 n=1 Tax=Jiangella sp. DSM 45060 TaxID=1798224 RepID=UPI00087A177A|nr:LpqB family beta-propeller domain-containing protein [Jiangella sp. DSM 45060]SDS67248.1 Dipeptidyl aminopeptidase/acylaminoacyl peptidase [Jiangella sp. DSM 45060]
MPETAPYGSWPSPVTAEIVAENDGRPGWVSHAGGALWWTRPQPAEGGRVALLRLPQGGDEPEVVLPVPWNVRTRVHEYGGLAYVALGDGSVVFAEYSDQRLYRFVPGSGDDPVPLTPEPSIPSGLRYAEPVQSPSGTEVWCVREEHTGPEPSDLRRALVAVPLDGSGDVRVLVEDTRFLACPRPSPDGGRLAWIGWDHPNMPWDGTVVRVAPVAADGSVGAPVTVAGGESESIPQIEWETPDALIAATDRTGWWNLHRVRVDVEGAEPEQLCDRAEEFAGPLWQLGLRWFVPLGEGEVAVIRGRASARLNLLVTTTGLLYDPLEDAHSEWAPTLAVSGRTVYGVAASPVAPYEVVQASVGAVSAVVPSTLSVPVTSLPLPQTRTFAGPGGRDVHAIVYPPSGLRFGGVGAEKPPYVVFVHGGPTGREPMVHDLEVAYFTSRGLGVVDVNYGGSTGFGRDYRERLRQQWGIVDVEDCVAAAKALVDEGFADGSRLAIRGGSAGGWTAAAALAFTDVFACATIMYPVLDLVAFRTGETHDFESQYLEGLVGPWPETEERYRERSPINVPEKFTVPFLLLQGLEDEVCPPGPTARFAERVAELGVEHEYITFEGEQHGFRRKETIVTALEKELALYARVFGFTAS